MSERPPRRDRDSAGLAIFECTAIVSDGRDVMIYTDEGGENPIRIRSTRLGALVMAAMDAAQGKNSTR